MNPRRTTTHRTLLGLTALALTTALVTAGCSADDGADDGAEPDPSTTSRGIDAREYYDDYDESTDETYSYGAPSGAGGATDSLQEAPDLDVPVPGPEEDNTFVDAGRGGFVPTRDDPLSTFALDVDSGSWGVARTFLTDGLRVPPASIRPEEWINALPYADPAPTDADLGLSTDSGPASSLDDGTQLVRVGVSAREVDPATRPRVNVTLVVDTSGSMDIRNRLGLVQSSLALLADRLSDDDTVSVVTFEDRARPILEPTPVSDTDTILEAIEDLTPGGSTNLEAGLSLGYEQARDAFDPEATNLVVLASDGVANVGATGPGSIVDRIAEEGADGIHLVTVGYGLGNYNDHLMEQLADLGDGFYSYVDTYGEAEQLFGRDLTTTLVPVAGEARTQVAFDPEAVTSYRLIGYENREIADEDFEDMAVDAGELGSGHHATALYEVVLAAGVEPGSPIGAATVRWTTVSAVTTGSATLELTAADPAATPSADLALASAAADLAELLKGRRAFTERGLTLDDLASRVSALVEADVPGAEELEAMVELAVDAGR